jgi:hypothetical protein
MDLAAGAFTQDRFLTAPKGASLFGHAHQPISASFLVRELPAEGLIHRNIDQG